MIYLLIVSFVWAFSFGLIKGRLTGLDPVGVAVVRLAFAALAFAPFLRLRKISRAAAGKLAVIGAVQFGLMYLFYLEAFQTLKAYEVALFTIFTPLCLALLDAMLSRRPVLRYFAAAALAIVGAGVVLWNRLATGDALVGFFWIQASNLCFAAGQLAYRRVRAGLSGVRNDEVFGVLYLSAFAVSVAASLVFTDWLHFRPDPSQWLTLAYLGLIASGAGFFAWNVGATRVNTGTLAAFNNAKIPLGVACSLLFFGENADLPRLIAGCALLVVAVLIAEFKTEPRVK